MKKLVTILLLLCSLFAVGQQGEYEEIIVRDSIYLNGVWYDHIPIDVIPALSTGSDGDILQLDSDTLKFVPNVLEDGFFDYTMQEEDSIHITNDTIWLPDEVNFVTIQGDEFHKYNDFVKMDFTQGVHVVVYNYLGELEEYVNPTQYERLGIMFQNLPVLIYIVNLTAPIPIVFVGDFRKGRTNKRMWLKNFYDRQIYVGDGLDIYGLTYGDGTLDADAQIGLSAGYLAFTDRTLEVPIRQTTDTWIVGYFDATGNPSGYNDMPYPVLTDIDVGVGTTGRIVCNNGGVPTVLDNGNYCWYWVCIDNDITSSDRTLMFMGKNQYSNLSTAQNNFDSERLEVEANLPISQGFGIKYGLLYQSRDSYVNGPKARIIEAREVVDNASGSFIPPTIPDDLVNGSDASYLHNHTSLYVERDSIVQESVTKTVGVGQDYETLAEAWNWLTTAQLSPGTVVVLDLIAGSYTLNDADIKTKQLIGVNLAIYGENKATTSITFDNTFRFYSSKLYLVDISFQGNSSHLFDIYDTYVVPWNCDITNNSNTGDVIQAEMSQIYAYGDCVFSSDDGIRLQTESSFICGGTSCVITGTYRAGSRGFVNYNTNQISLYCPLIVENKEWFMDGAGYINQNAQSLTMTNVDHVLKSYNSNAGTVRLDTSLLDIGTATWIDSNTIDDNDFFGTYVSGLRIIDNEETHENNHKKLISEIDLKDTTFHAKLDSIYANYARIMELEFDYVLEMRNGDGNLYPGTVVFIDSLYNDGDLGYNEPVIFRFIEETGGPNSRLEGVTTFAKNYGTNGMYTLYGTKTITQQTGGGNIGFMYSGFDRVYLDAGWAGTAVATVGELQIYSTDEYLDGWYSGVQSWATNYDDGNLGTVVGISNAVNNDYTGNIDWAVTAWNLVSNYDTIQTANTTFNRIDNEIGGYIENAEFIDNRLENHGEIVELNGLTFDYGINDGTVGTFKVINIPTWTGNVGTINYPIYSNNVNESYMAGGIDLSYTKSNYNSENYQSLTETGGAVAFDISSGAIADVTIDEPTTVTITNLEQGVEVNLAVTQGDGDNDNITITSSGLTVKWRGGLSDLTDTSGAIDVLSMKRIGSILFVTIGLDYQ